MSAQAKASDDEIEALIRRGLTVTQICKALGYKSAGTSTRIQRIAKDRGLPLSRGPAGDYTDDAKAAAAAFQHKLQNNARKHIDVQNGVVLVGSDAHYWPGIISTAHRAFCKLAAELRPAAVILNGDGFDGASISRFPRIGWDIRPKVEEELSCCIERMGEIESAAGTKQLYWPLGNHDARYETFLAAHAPEFQGVSGFHLKDKFPLWTPCWAVWINGHTVVKHRDKGGQHAPFTSTLRSGKSMVLGHLHSAKVMPFTDYDGTRYGVDCGTLAEPDGPQFVDYTEDGAKDWRSAFCVLTYWRGRLLIPQHCQVLEDGKVEYLGQVLEV